MKSIDIAEYIAIYRQVFFYILYMLYRITIYITLTLVEVWGDMMLKKRFRREEEESDDDTSIYSKNVRELLLDDDELSPMEEAFMNGYEDAI